MIKTKQECKLLYTSPIYDNNGIIVYYLKLSQKALLEATRHRHLISWTVTSSRYALRKINIELEPTGNDNIDQGYISYLKGYIDDALKNNISLDIVSKLLPQSFLYTAQVSFNLRSLLYFLRLRLAKDAHRDIRIIALKMVEELPEEYKELVFEDKQIKKYYQETKDWFYNKI